MKTALFAFVLLSLSAVAVRAQLPSAGTLDGVGLNTNVVTDATSTALLQSAGVKFLRVGLPWWYVEQTQGVYNFTEYDKMVNAYKPLGIRITYILSGSDGNPPAAYGTDPGTEVYRQGFSNFCAAAASRYKAEGVEFELWNEPNSTSWPGGANADQYMALANLAVPAIRNADPNATIIGPATCPSSTGIDTTFLTSCFNYGTRYPGQKGLLDLVDAVSVHPYQSTSGDIYHHPAPPENVVSQYGDATKGTGLKGLIHTYDPNGTMPIASTEWGYSTVMPGITAQLQGDYLARSFLINMSQGIVQSNWYDFTNDGTDPNNMEDNFGTMTASLVPKPAYNEMRLLTSSLKGETFTSRLSDSHTSDWLLVFTPASGQKTLAAWTTGTSHIVTVSGWGTLNLTSTPFYVNPTLLPGDANLDGTVDVLDLAILAANYRKHVTGGWMQGDFNNDGVVDVEDLALLAANYRHSLASDVVPAYDGLDAEAIRALSLAGVTVVPEPGAIVLLATGVAGLLAYAWRRRRYLQLSPNGERTR